MTQGIIAGGTNYENQSLTDIIKDIHSWIEYSKEVAEYIETTITEIKSTDFYLKIHCDYKAFVYESIRICKTNMEDFNVVLNAIESNTLTNSIVALFFKIGKRAVENSDENSRCFRSGDERWHDYEDENFKKLESVCAKFGDYSATLWDVTSAAARLKDYVNVPQEVSTMKIEDNSIYIGDGNTITGSSIGKNNKTTNTLDGDSKEKVPSKIFWQIVVPIVVGVAVVAICAWLGIQN